MSGLALLLGKAFQPSTRTRVEAGSPPLPRFVGQFCVSAVYGRSLSRGMPESRMKAYASSPVAPSQPPEPPQCCGFGTQSTSAWAETLTSLLPERCSCASTASTADIAQQLPQLPWLRIRGPSSSASPPCVASPSSSRRVAFDRANARALLWMNETAADFWPCARDGLYPIKPCRSTS